MDNGKADIIAGIRELRAKAAEQLTGNEYYMIVQQLDSLASSAELSDAAARSVFNLISARLGGGAPAQSASGGPEIPETPDTPAHPDTPSTPEEPVVPDSPAQPDGSPGPEIPSPPSSPAEPQTPPEASAALAAGFDERVQIITPSANSFGMPQATVAVRIAEPDTPSEPDLDILVQEAAPATSGLGAAVMAARRLVEEKLNGNSYYAAANLLGQLQVLPPVAGGGEAARPEGFEGALALLRREAEHLSGMAAAEASRVIAALESVLMPTAQPVAEKPVETAAPQSSAPEPKPEAMMPKPEPEPRTGFDDLADAAWQRVQQVSAADLRPAAALNGSAAPAPVEAETVSPAAVSVAPAEILEQDNAEAFNDGGSESRSSEPCYLHEFELADAKHGASSHQEPAAEAGADAAAETERQTAVSAEAEALIALAETAFDEPVAAEDDNVLTVQFEEVTESQASESEEAVPLEEPVISADKPQAVELAIATAEPPVADAEPAVAETEPAAADAEPAVAEAEPAAVDAEPAVAEAEPAVGEVKPVVAATESAAETGPAAASSPLIEEPAEPAHATVSASRDAADEIPAVQPALAAQTASGKPAKRGFFGRLFGGSSAENRR